APPTIQGTIVGTFAYMSPEQAEGKKVDVRSDIFSFGSVLYEMVTARRPFQGETHMSTVAAILMKEPSPVSEVSREIPPELERIILRCLRKEPERRFQHMDDLKIALEELKEESTISGRLASGVLIPARPRAKQRRQMLALLLSAVGVVLLLGVGAILWWERKPAPTAPRPVLTRLTSDTGLCT